MEKFDGNMVTGLAQILYPDLWEPTPFKEGGVAKPNSEAYRARLVFTPEEAKSLITRAKACAVQCFPGMEWSDLNTGAFKMGDKINAKRKATGKTPYDWAEGKVIVDVKSSPKHPPDVVKPVGNETEVLMPGSLKGGEVVRASVNVAPFRQGDGGVTPYLNAVMLFAPLGAEHPIYGKLVKMGGRSAADVFADYMGQEMTEDPTGGVIDL